MRLDFIACKYTDFIQYGKMIEYFFVKVKENLADVHFYTILIPTRLSARRKYKITKTRQHCTGK